jgi:hypothetical protein
MSPGGSPPRVSTVIGAILTSPWQTIVRRWNWKSACVSSVVRASIFFLANVGAGVDAAAQAFVTEWCYRAVSAGFFGAMTEAFRHAEPRWQATLAVMLLLPATSHGLEFVVHATRGTPNLATSIAISMAFTAGSTVFHLHAMRQGVLVVGDGRRPILDDLRRLPHLWGSLLFVPALHLARLVRGRVRAALPQPTR